MKVLFLTNIPSPYRIAFYNELGKHCDLTVLFEKEASSERDASWSKFAFQNFKGVILKGITVDVDMAFSPGVLTYLRKDFDHIVCTDFLSPTGMLAISAMRRKGIPYYLESDGGFARSAGGVKEKLKAHFISGAKGYFSTGAEHDGYYLRYGADKSKLIRYPFSSVRDCQILKGPVQNKKELRRKLGIEEEKVVLAVGQFIPRKGFDVLLKAAQTMDGTVGFYFVGGEPTEEYIKLRGNLQNVHFIGFQRPEALAEYYQAADVFALPTREDIWGLVINEAMAYGLPVVTTESCLAGVEMIAPGVNGFLVEPENPCALAEKIEAALKNADSMGMKALETAHQYTIETMADRHLRVFEEKAK